MNAFILIAEQISQLPGSFLYYLATLLMLEMALVFAGRAWWHQRGWASGRLVLALALFTFLCLAQLALALLAAAGVLDGPYLLPPLERALAAGLTGMWLWLAWFPQPSRLGDGAAGVLGLGVAVGAGLTLGAWLQTGVPPFNTSWLDSIWQGVMLALVGLGLVLTVMARRPHWGLALVALGMLAVGHALHYFFPIEGNFAGAVRLAELLAAPLWTALVYVRSTPRPVAASAPRFEPLTPRPVAVAAPATPTPPTTATTRPLDPKAAVALAALSVTQRANEIGQLATLGLTHAVQADTTLILWPPNEFGQCHVLSAYDAEKQDLPTRQSLLLAALPEIKAAYETRDLRTLTAERNGAEIRRVLTAVGLTGAGPMLAMPALPLDTAEDTPTPTAVLVLCNWRSRRYWSPDEQMLVRALAEPIAEALAREARLNAQTAEQQRLLREANLRAEQAEAARHQTQIQLDRLAADLDEARENAQQLTTEVRQLRLNVPARDAASDLDGLRDSLQSAQQQMQALTEQIRAELAAEWQNREAELRAEAHTAVLAVVAHAADLDQARAQLSALQHELDQAHTNTTQFAPAAFSRESLEVIISLTQEIRQPLSSIMGYADLLLGESVGLLGATQRKFMERIARSCQRLEALLNDLIRVADIDAGALQLSRRTINVRQMVEDVLRPLEAQARDRAVTLKVDLVEPLPTINADEDALRQMLSHLLTNAITASRVEGDITLTVRGEGQSAHDHQQAEFLFVSVRDAGGGTPATDQPRVFTRVYRANMPLIIGLGDTGVGLSVTKALVEAHGGRIWLTSEEGVGNTFSVLLPIYDRSTTSPSSTLAALLEG